MSLRIRLSATLFMTVLTFSALAADYRTDTFVRAHGFRVEISPGPPPDATGQGPWRTLDGGTLTFNETEGTTTRADKYKTSATGIAEFTEVTLTGEIATLGRRSATKLAADSFDTDLNPHVVAIHMEPLVFPAVPASDGRNDQYRTFQPGQPELGQVTFTINEHPDSANDIAAWVKDTYEGKDVRRDFTVNLRQSASENSVRSYIFSDCVPVIYAPLSGVDVGAAGAINQLTLTVGCNRVQFDGLPAGVGQWISDMLQKGMDSDVFRTVAVTFLNREGSDLREYKFNEAFITQYIFPELNANSEETLVEGVAFQPGYWEEILP